MDENDKMSDADLAYYKGMQQSSSRSSSFGRYDEGYRPPNAPLKPIDGLTEGDRIALWIFGAGVACGTVATICFEALLGWWIR